MTQFADQRCIDIHPTAVLIGDVEIGAGTVVGPYCVLTGPIEIGQNCQIGAHSIIGGLPEHRLHGTAGMIRIGSGTIIREGCVIHHGTGVRDTTIGQDCWILNRVYIAHDCCIGDHVILSSGVALGGAATILEGANIGMNAAVHQFGCVGGYSMIGMATPVTKDVPPFCVAAGSPIRLLRANHHAFGLLSLDASAVQALASALEYSKEIPKIVQLIDDFNQHATRKPLFEIAYRSSQLRKPR